MKRAFTNPLFAPAKNLTMYTHGKESVTLSLLDLILELLDEKNDWCNLEEITSKVKSSESETTTVLDFLAQYDFVVLDTSDRKAGIKARISPRIHEFLEEVRQVEIKELF